MKHLRIAAFLALSLSASRAAAQNPAPPEKTGLPVGQKAPAFALQDQTGQQRTLANLGKDAEYVALVFYRSVGW